MTTRKRRPSTDDEAIEVAEKPLTLTEMKQRAMNVRSAAKLHYITDPAERSVDWWWANGSVTSMKPDGTRETIRFREYITTSGFTAWSQEEKWAQQRDTFWNDVELKVLTNLRDETIKEKIDELRVMRQSRAYLTEYLFPLKDPKSPDGIRRYAADHKLAGLPVFPLELGSMPKFLESYLKLDERVALKRGDALMHANSEIDDITGGVVEQKESPGKQVARAHNMSSDDVRTLARTLLKKREESLSEVVETIAVEEVEEIEDDDEADDESI